ncbi:MAG TPA: DMT family protein [Verrucomicrobiae bacterium]|nr:DMT family protein [Verrucomicrobiae bacterium]
MNTTPDLGSRLLPILLLACSNIFMTFAWYGHLKFKGKPLALVILVSWGIAFFEYVLMVPANRWGHSVYSATQLKILQEVITIVVFCGFAVLYLHEKIRWNHIAAFLCILAAVAFTFLPKNPQ